uniref:Gag-Pol polyprotein n=1 Tax=Tanacetum cinerariifolium TaxID=118510 RepID=A0A699HSL7_TANCI|nr:hypothetical protein [Tanacetum cinerariifolium]
MEAGGKDRPPMLAPGNYVQWKFKIKRYIDTKPNNEHIYYCLQNPPYKFKWTEKTILVREGIDNDIYSTVDAYPNACEMWKAIKRLKFYKMMNELVRNQCDFTNHQLNVQFLLQLQLEWQRFVTLAKQSQELKTVSYHKLYDILKQYQNEVNVIRAERLARTVDTLALIAQQQLKIYKPTNNNLRTSSNTSRANQDDTSRINRGTRYDNHRAVNVPGARENVGTKADWRDDIDDKLDDQEFEAHYMYMA